MSSGDIRFFPHGRLPAGGEVIEGHVVATGASEPSLATQEHLERTHFHVGTDVARLMNLRADAGEDRFSASLAEAKAPPVTSLHVHAQQVEVLDLDRMPGVRRLKGFPKHMGGRTEVLAYGVPLGALPAATRALIRGAKPDAARPQQVILFVPTRNGHTPERITGAGIANGVYKASRQGLHPGYDGLLPWRGAAERR